MVRFVAQVEQIRLESSPLDEDLVDRVPDDPLGQPRAIIVLEQPQQPATCAAYPQQEARDRVKAKPDLALFYRCADIPETRHIAVECDPVQRGGIHDVDLEELERYRNQGREVLANDAESDAPPIDRHRSVAAARGAAGDEIPAERIVMA